jgi:hypothetical protein
VPAEKAKTTCELGLGLEPCTRVRTVLSQAALPDGRPDSSTALNLILTIDSDYEASMLPGLAGGLTRDVTSPSQAIAG